MKKTSDRQILDIIAAIFQMTPEDDVTPVKRIRSLVAETGRITVYQQPAVEADDATNN